MRRYQRLVRMTPAARGEISSSSIRRFTIARADKPLNGAEQAFLEGIWRNFGLGQDSWARAIGRTRPTRAVPEDDPYAVLGVPRTSTTTPCAPPGAS